MPPRRKPDYSFASEVSMRFRRISDDPSNVRARESTRARNDLPSLTQQHHAASCDLNNIMKQFGVVKDIPVVPYPAEYFGDDSASDLSLREALDNVRNAEKHFSALPSDLRARFDNSYMSLWAWINDPRNADEAVKLGLLKRVPAASTAAPAAPEAPAGS